MADWPLRGGGNRFEAFGITLSDSGGTIVTPGGIGTYGSWVQLLAATSFDADYIEVILYSGTAFTEWAVDIGIGGAGSEQVLLHQLRHISGTSFGYAHTFRVPMRIPAGSRISARCMASSGSSSLRVAGVIGSLSFASSPGFERFERLGQSATLGALVDHNVVDEKGPWDQIGTSTFDYQALMFAFQSEDPPLSASSTVRMLLDIGVGGAGSEQILIPDLCLRLSENEGVVFPPTVGPFPVSLPSGTRITARMQPDSVAQIDHRTIWVTAYGMG